MVMVSPISLLHNTISHTCTMVYGSLICGHLGPPPTLSSHFCTQLLVNVSSFLFVVYIQDENCWGIRYINFQCWQNFPMYTSTEVYESPVSVWFLNRTHNYCLLIIKVPFSLQRHLTGLLFSISPMTNKIACLLCLCASYEVSQRVFILSKLNFQRCTHMCLNNVHVFLHIDFLLIWKSTCYGSKLFFLFSLCVEGRCMCYGARVETGGQFPGVAIRQSASTFIC